MVDQMLKSTEIAVDIVIFNLDSTDYVILNAMTTPTDQHAAAAQQQFSIDVDLLPAL